MQQFADLFQGISLGQTIVWVCAIVTLGKTFNSILEKYHAHKKTVEKEDEVVAQHTKSISELSDKIDVLIEKVNTIDDKVNTIDDNNNKSEAKRLRREILKFGDLLRDGRVPSKDSFEDIFDCNTEYEDLIARKGIKNGFTAQEMKIIEKSYRELYGNITED